jgi:phage shock protein A
MTEEDKKLLSTFEARLRHLLYEYQQLKQKNEELKEVIRKKDETIEEIQSNYKSLDTKYANLKLAKIISINDSEAKDTKQRLSKLVREVDKCIALLNG